MRLSSKVGIFGAVPGDVTFKVTFVTTEITSVSAMKRKKLEKGSHVLVLLPEGAADSGVVPGAARQSL